MDAEAASLLRLLDEDGAAVLRLLDRHHADDDESRRLWADNPELYRAFTERLVRESHLARALDLARERQEFLEKHPPAGPKNPVPEGPELRHQLALAAARGGNPGYAEGLLAPLLALARGPDAATAMTVHVRVEVLGLHARLLKDRAGRDPDRLRAAAQAYDAAAAVPGASGLPDAGTYPLVNAATVWRLAGDADRSRERAAEVVRRVEGLSPGRVAGDRWLTATMGEAYLLLGDHGRAVDWYLRAVDMARAAGAVGELLSIRSNLLKLAAAGATETPDWIEAHVGGVVVFAGHLLDAPDRAARGLPPRFPDDPELIAAVRAAIDAKLAGHNAAVGFCSLASGADILFAEAVLARGARLHVVLPFARADFVATSVAAAGPGWVERFDAVLKEVGRDGLHHATAEPHLGAADVLYDFASTFCQGLAVLRAREQVVEPRALVVLDRGAEAATGGTLSFLQTWEAAGRPAEVIDLAALRGGPPAVPTAAVSVAPPAGGPGLPRLVKAVLFADVAGFSRIEEAFYPRFLAAYEALLADVHASEAGAKVEYANTWGDGLYAVFARADGAAAFALELMDRAAAHDWAGLGLGPGVPLRAAQHVGPVFAVADPFQGRPGYTGQHVNRAARIEPVTVPGCVYASEAFAAHLVMTAAAAFGCETVGVQTLPKGYDRCPLYHVTRAT